MRQTGSQFAADHAVLIAEDPVWLIHRLTEGSDTVSRSYRELVEKQISRAIAEGKLRGLEGEGKPLPDRSGEAFTDMATQVALRMMAEAGVLPEEFKLKKLLDGARQVYQEAKSDAERRAAMAVIAELDLRYNIAVEARRKFMAP